MFRALTKDGVEVRGWYMELAGRYIITPKVETTAMVGATVDLRNHYGDKVVCDFVEINPETLGLETGQKDKNKVEIVGGWGPGLEKGGDDIKVGNFPDSVLVFWDNKLAAFYAGTLEGNLSPRMLSNYTYEYHNIAEITGWKAKEIK